MTYKEMVKIVKQAIANGEKLHGWMRDIAIDIALEEAEQNLVEIKKAKNKGAW